MKLPFFVTVAFLVFAAASQCRAENLALPSTSEALKSIPALFYAESPRQIPAAVIDHGNLAYLPYTSFGIGPDREVNIYGDPRHPVRIEVALYGDLSHSEVEMRRSIDLLHRLVAQIELGGISLQGGKMLRSGLVAEITPPGDPESRGGWYASLSDLDKLAEARSTSLDVNAIVVAKDDPGDAGWNSDDLKRARMFSPASGDDRVYLKSYVRKGHHYVPATKS